MSWEKHLANNRIGSQLSLQRSQTGIVDVIENRHKACRTTESNNAQRPSSDWCKKSVHYHTSCTQDNDGQKN